MTTSNSPAVITDDGAASLAPIDLASLASAAAGLSTTTKQEAVVRRYYETVDSGESDAVVELFTHDAVYHRPGYQPMVGREALHRFYSGQRVIAHGRHMITHIFPAGSAHVAVEGRFTGRLKDGTDVDLGFADFFTLRRTLIATRTTYFAVAAV